MPVQVKRCRGSPPAWPEYIGEALPDRHTCQEPTGWQGARKNGLLRQVRPIAHVVTELPHHHGVEGGGSPGPVQDQKMVGQSGMDGKSRLAGVLPGGVLPPLADHRGSTKQGDTRSREIEKKGEQSSHQFGMVATGRFGYRRKGPTMPSSHESSSDTLCVVS